MSSSRSTGRAFLLTSVFTERHLGSRDPRIPNSRTGTVTVGTLHDDVLLEIFDFYRQSFGDHPSSERVWNNKNGWFKLAHMCRNWRSVVLASPYRLRLRLYFAHDTPTRAAALQHYPHFPIVVDYSNVDWNANVLRCFVSALRYPDRVCRIANKGSYKYEHFAIISNALNSSFPALESLELHDSWKFEATVLLSSRFRTSIQSIRLLRLDGSSPLISPVLSVTTSLVDLTLNVVTIRYLTDGASIFTHLQGLPHLRNLQVSESPKIGFYDEEMIPLPPTTTTLLAELTYFRLSAGYSEIERFVAGLAAPSLRELHISIQNACSILNPNLSEFIRVAGIVFFAARLAISHQSFRTSLFAHPLSIDGPPSKIVTIETRSLARLDNAPSPMLATVEDVFLSLSDPIEFDEPFPLEDLREFIKEFRNVKTLRLHHGLETIVADILRPPTENPLPAGEEVVLDAIIPNSMSIHHSGSRFTSDILPSLEEIVVYARAPNMSIDEKEIASVLESSEHFTTARHRVGRPVKAFWNTYGKVPRYFVS